MSAPAWLRSARFAISFLIVLVLAGCAAYEHHRAGIDAMERGDYGTAVDEFRQATELAPKDFEYRKDWLVHRETATNKLLAMADTALAEGRDAEAEKHYRTILRFERDNARARAGLENIARRMRAAEDAAEARKALKRGDTAQALQWAARALESAPDQAEARAVKREIEILQSRDLLLTPGLGALYKKPINLEFRDASIKIVFEALSRTTGINFIFDRDVRSDLKTTVFLKQTTLEDSIDVILSTNQLDKKILNASSVLIYPNTAAKIKEYQDLLVKAFYLANVEAKQTASMLKTVLKIKEIFVDDRYNMLILRESPETIALAAQLIALLDLEEPEVMLEVAVLEVNRSSLLNLGVQFSDQLTISPLGGTTTGGTTGTDPSTRVFSLTDLRHLNSDLLGITVPSATINLQKTDGDAKLLANPRMRVRDREKAKILVGDKVPVVTTTSTATGFIAESIQYLDVGLKLEVEPTIYLHDEIGLKISLEVSSLVSAIKTNNGSQAYQIGTRNYSSALRLKDGETQVLAGLIKDEDRMTASRLPLLGDLPVLGRLFSSQSDSRQKTEIVMSITPRLIRNIQRKAPAAETFWSGTEASLRTKPLQLRSIDDAAPQAAAGTAKPAPALAASTASATAASGIKLLWRGPSAGRVGEVVNLDLSLDSPEALRAAPIQLAFDPLQFEVVSVTEGNFFSKGGKSAFAQVVDKASGRISIGASSSEAVGAGGEGRLLSISLKPLVANPEAEISVVALTPVGSSQAVARPALPIIHKMAIAP
jgi:general secretion pathway protein D